MKHKGKLCAAGMILFTIAYWEMSELPLVREPGIYVCHSIITYEPLNFHSSSVRVWKRLPDTMLEVTNLATAYSVVISRDGKLKCKTPDGSIRTW